jgi:hypothetical protein
MLLVMWDKILVVRAVIGQSKQTGEAISMFTVG